MSLETRTGTPVFDYELDPKLQKKMVGTTETTRELLLISLYTDALQSPPDNLTEDRWWQNLDITYRCFICGEMLADIGNEYCAGGINGISKRAIQQKIKMTVSSIWHNSPPEVQEAFPLKMLI